MDKLHFLTAGIPTSTAPRSYDRAFNDLIKMGLGGLEIEFVRGVTMNAATQKMVKSLSKELGLVLTAHGPYFINLNSPEEDKYEASIKRILDTARVCYACGGYSITFHAAFYLKQENEPVYRNVKKAMQDIISTLNSEGVEIWVRPELTGKATQWGDLDELIRISKDVEMVLPCVDFAHLHARTAGGWNTYDEFCKVFEKIGKELGDNALKNFHAHVAGIEYTQKGEKKHLMLEEADLDYKSLMRAFKDFDVKGVVVCESPCMETDAMLLQQVYNSL